MVSLGIAFIFVYIKPKRILRNIFIYGSKGGIGKAKKPQLKTPAKKVLVEEPGDIWGEPKFVEALL